MAIDARHMHGIDCVALPERVESSLECESSDPRPEAQSLHADSTQRRLFARWGLPREEQLLLLLPTDASRLGFKAQGGSAWVAVERRSWTSNTAPDIRVLMRQAGARVARLIGG